ncbi:MAG: hypothetical protein PHI34_01970 [Acidobacteriota bacterium]|nr:hypothetical protein [Acidobacteriota bacterium]
MAASPLPPARPRPAGIRFSTRIEAPRPVPVRSRRRRAARTTRFVSSQATSGSSPETATLRPGAASMVRLSCRLIH